MMTWALRPHGVRTRGKKRGGDFGLPELCLQAPPNHIDCLGPTAFDDLKSSTADTVVFPSMCLASCSGILSVTFVMLILGVLIASA